jgi:hypothetical protein
MISCALIKEIDDPEPSYIITRVTKILKEKYRHTQGPDVLGQCLASSNKSCLDRGTEEDLCREGETLEL